MVETTGPVPTAEDLWALLISLFEDQHGVKITYTLEKTDKWRKKNKMLITDDPGRDFDRWEREQEEWSARLREGKEGENAGEN